MTTTTVRKRAATGALHRPRPRRRARLPDRVQRRPVDPRQVRALAARWSCRTPAYRHRRHPDDAGAGEGAADGHGPRACSRPEAMARTGARRSSSRWNRSPENNRAPGNTCLQRLRPAGAAGPPWQDASQIDSKGCGANMRVAPLGLVPGLSDEQRAGAAQLQSALTHGHPTALAASDLTAHAVRLLAAGRRADRTGRAAALVRLREPQPLPRALARRPVDPQPGPRPRSTSSRAAGTSAWRSSTGSSEAVRTASPETDPCLADRRGLDRRGGHGHRAALLPALRRRAVDGPAPRPPAPPATRTRSPAWPARSRAPTWAPTPGRPSGRTGSSTGATCWPSARSGTLEPMIDALDIDLAPVVAESPTRCCSRRSPARICTASRP